MKRRTTWTLAVLVLVVGSIVLSGVLTEPPITMTAIGKVGRKYRNGIILDVRLQNNRPWAIYYHGLGDEMSASYHISRKTVAGWQELDTQQFDYVYPVVRERIAPRGSVNIHVFASEADSPTESRIGVDCYTIWDCEMMGTKWGRMFSTSTTVWSASLPIDCTKNTAREVPVTVEADGSFGIAGIPMSKAMLVGILTNASKEFGRDMSIIVSAREGTAYSRITPVTDLCSAIGLTNITLRTTCLPGLTVAAASLPQVTNATAGQAQP